MNVKEVSKTKAFDCAIHKFSHPSPALGGLVTEWQAIVPSSASPDNPLPVLYFYSGLTCTSDNVIQKAFAAPACAEHGIILVACDTSPRGAGAPEEDACWDFGTGAGFYVDAKQGDYRQHYNMYTFCHDELPGAVVAALGKKANIDRAAVMGHSMGGMGALVAALRLPQSYSSVSAFAPVCHPSACAWGKKAFSKYLGADEAIWADYDPVKLVEAGKRATSEILIDQGEADSFLSAGQLLPVDFVKACNAQGQAVKLRMHEGFGHDYFFIQTFMAEHIKFHAMHF